MEKPRIQAELSVLVGRYLRETNPAIYTKFNEFCRLAHVLPKGCPSMDSALDVRFRHLPPDQFIQFLKTLTPDDDFPSLFRRSCPFPAEPRPPSTLTVVGAVRAHRESVYNLAFDPLSRFVCSASDAGTIKLFRLPDFREICAFCGHTETIVSLSVHPNAGHLLSASHDGTVRLWSLNTGKGEWVIEKFTLGEVHWATFSPDGSLIGAACEDGHVFLWRTDAALQGSAPFQTFTSPDGHPMIWVCFSPGGEFVGFSTEASSVVIASLSTSKECELRLHTGRASLIQFSRRLYPSAFGPAPRILTMANDDGTLAIWTLEPDGWTACEFFRAQSLGRRVKIHMCVWDSADSLVVVLRKSGAVVLDSRSGQAVAQLPDTADCGLVCECPRRPGVFAIVSASGQVAVWDVKEVEILANWTPPQPIALVECVWSSCGKYICASDDQGVVFLFRFSMSGHRSLQAATRRAVPCSLQFEVDADLSFVARCHRDEVRLARRIDEIQLGAIDRPQPQLPLMTPPEYISVVLKRARNPLAVLPGDDPETIEVDYESEFTSPETERPRVEIELIVPPSDRSWHKIYGPLERLDRPPWLISFSSNVFVPQFGDMVIYIHEANIRGIVDPVIYNFQKFTLSRIASIEPVPDGFLLSLCTAAAISFQLIFAFTEHCDFLFPHQAFRAFSGIMPRLAAGVGIAFRASGMKCRGRIEHVRADSSHDPLECLRVVTRDATLQVSPWQVLEIGGEEVAAPYQSIGIRPLELIRQLPHERELPGVGSRAGQPMELGLIVARLKSGWYRSAMAVGFDCRLLLGQLRAGVKRDLDQQLAPWINLIWAFVQRMAVGGT
jgi:WD40 repeat protein